eukprot:g1378.t1
MSMLNLATRLRPLGNRLLVQKALAETTTASGIILPESAKAKIPQGTVVAVGPGEKNMDGNIVPMNIAVDANVFLPEYGGTKIPVADGEAELFLYREDEILAIIED